MAKFIFVTGGVVSGLGKGITAASLGRLLKARGFKVAAQKLDPYINVDPGTMSPYQHGEVFVTNDGAETDLDLGHYERFIDEDLKDKDCLILTGNDLHHLKNVMRSKNGEKIICIDINGMVYLCVLDDLDQGLIKIVEELDEIMNWMLRLL